MRRPWLKILPLLLSLGLIWPTAVPAQVDQAGINRMLVESYDLLEAGKLDRAKAIFAQILQQDPGNPLALNNLGAVLVKEKKYPEALNYFKQALPRAGGYQVKINRVCDAQGLCLAFRPDLEVYGNQELLPLVRMNIQMVEARLAIRK
jgi:tetratricopeptide (TPR) repeat protein